MFRRQLSTVIEWKDQDPDLLFYRIETPTDEIKHASKLIVSPGQGCLLVYDGALQDVLTRQGVYFLETDNHPFITTFLKLRQAFESEHKMHVYFFRTAELVNQGWGTSAPVKYMDPAYQIPIQLGANGNFSVLISEPEKMFTQIVGSKARYTTEEMQDLVVSRVTPILVSTLAQSGFSYKEIDSRLADLSGQMKAEINATVEQIGLQLTDFRVLSTIFDEATVERIGKIADLTSEALAAAEVGLDYVQLEKLRALRDAARNEGGLAGAGLQVGAGLELSRSLMAQKDSILAAGDGSAAAVTQLKKLKLLLDEQIITQEEFDDKKKGILAKI